MPDHMFKKFIYFVHIRPAPALPGRAERGAPRAGRLRSFPRLEGNCTKSRLSLGI